MTTHEESTPEDEAWFAEVCAELDGLIHRIKDRAHGDESAIWRVEKVVVAHRDASADEEERRLLAALLVVFNAASMLCRRH